MDVEGIILVLSCQKHRYTRLINLNLNKHSYNNWKVIKVMGNDFSVTAFNYNKEDIGIDPETNTTFVPNQKELELFKKEKMNLYKGTWTVCFLYGISAFILLVTVLFTDVGRTYIYDKYFPAVMTYVLGAIIIIIYLIYSIYNIKPRKLGKPKSKFNNCPDYWSY